MKKIIITILLILFVVLILFIMMAKQKGAKFILPKESLIGQSAPVFSLPDLNFKKVNTADFFGKKPVLLFFWTTWCPHCRVAIKNLNKDAPALEAKGVAVLTVDAGESQELVKDYMNKSNYNVAVLMDQDSAVAQSYGVMGVPTFLLIGRDGVVKTFSNSLPEDYENILLK